MRALSNWLGLKIGYFVYHGYANPRPDAEIAGAGEISWCPPGSRSAAPAYQRLASVASAFFPRAMPAVVAAGRSTPTGSARSAGLPSAALCHHAYARVREDGESPGRLFSSEKVMILGLSAPGLPRRTCNSATRRQALARAVSRPRRSSALSASAISWTNLPGARQPRESRAKAVPNHLGYGT
jgi:hypothetical protein